MKIALAVANTLIAALMWFWFYEFPLIKIVRFTLNRDLPLLHELIGFGLILSIVVIVLSIITSWIAVFTKKKSFAPIAVLLVIACVPAYVFIWFLDQNLGVAVSDPITPPTLPDDRL